VIVTIDFDSPGQQRLRRWIDTLLDALEAEPNAIPGMTCGHFYASLAGLPGAQLVEWSSQAHDDALARHGRAD
jgi:hypothetical protein